MRAVYPYRDDGVGARDLFLSIMSLKRFAAIDRIVVISDDLPDSVVRKLTDNKIHLQLMPQADQSVSTLSVMNKMVGFCREADPDEYFLFMHDDIVLLDRYQQKHVYGGFLSDRVTMGGVHSRARAATQHYLKQAGLPERDYEFHRPITIHAGTFLSVLESAPKVSTGYSIKSLYLNSMPDFWVTPKYHMEADWKPKGSITAQTIERFKELHGAISLNESVSPCAVNAIQSIIEV